jgi:hypothetical protein
MSKKSAVTHLAVASFMLAAVACSRGQSATGGGGENDVEWALESFDVPAGHRQQVGEMLKSLLQPQKARVNISPDGRLLVMAPRGMHKQIRAALTPLMNKPIPGASRLKLTYWMVKAVPGGAGSAAAPPGPGLGEIAPALAEVEKATGPAQMTLLERIVLRSTSGEHASTEARNFTVKHEVSIVEGRVVGRVYIHTFVVRDPGNNSAASLKEVLHTQVSLLPGQLAVIAETGVAGRLRDQAKTTTSEGEWTLLIAVKATVDDDADRP